MFCFFLDYNATCHFNRNLTKVKSYTYAVQFHSVKVFKMFNLFRAGGEDDFEMFLESVRERSLKATAHLRKGNKISVAVYAIVFFLPGKYGKIAL